MTISIPPITSSAPPHPVWPSGTYQVLSDASGKELMRLMGATAIVDSWKSIAAAAVNPADSSAVQQACASDIFANTAEWRNVQSGLWVFSTVVVP